MNKNYNSFNCPRLLNLLNNHIILLIIFVLDLRPKGRGRPQRILLGIWPEAHIQGVIRAVVFRDPQHIKEEAINLGYPRLQVIVTYILILSCVSKQTLLF